MAQINIAIRFDCCLDNTKGTMLNVEWSDTVKSIKLQIQQKYGPPPEQQELSLYLMGKVLRDGCTLGDYAIHGGSILRLKLKSGNNRSFPSSPIKKQKEQYLTIKEPTGSVIDMINFSRNLSIKSIKQQIENEKGFPISKQKLMFKNKVLKNDRKVSDYNMNQMEYYIFQCILQSLFNQ
eukprot:446371_1